MRSGSALWPPRTPVALDHCRRRSRSYCWDSGALVAGSQSELQNGQKNRQEQAASHQNAPTGTLSYLYLLNTWPPKHVARPRNELDYPSRLACEPRQVFADQFHDTLAIIRSPISRWITAAKHGISHPAPAVEVSVTDTAMDVQTEWVVFPDLHTRSEWWTLKEKPLDAGFRRWRWCLERRSSLGT